MRAPCLALKSVIMGGSRPLAIIDDQHSCTVGDTIVIEVGGSLIEFVVETICSRRLRCDLVAHDTDSDLDVTSVRHCVWSAAAPRRRISEGRSLAWASSTLTTC